MQIANRVNEILPSGTLMMSQKARELKAAGQDIISLTVGEPDFQAPLNIKQKAIEALKEQDVDHYIATGGIMPLKEAICNFHNQKDGTSWNPKQVAVFTGAKFALYITFQTVINPGDEVLIPAPYWVSYTEQVKLAQGTPVIVPSSFERGFKISVEELEQYLTPKTKILLLTSPSNPTGAMYTRDELEVIAKWAIEKNITILSDEIYYELVYKDMESCSIASLSTEIQEHVIVINGLSKSVAMTGWRIGYVLASEELIQAMTDLASHITGNSTVVAQYAAIEAFSQETIVAKEEMKKQFEQRIDTFYPLISSIPGFRVNKPKASFYLFVHVAEAAKQCGFASVEDFAIALLEEVGVAVVSGHNFGTPDYIRLSCATNEATLIEAARRIKTFVETKL